jgi:hypothetical protein
VSVYVPALLGAVGVIGVMVELLRRRQLSEKYAALWLVVGIVVVVVAAAPQVLRAAADVVGVETPSNLLFFVGMLTLLSVCVHLSWETSRLEDETRCLAEEVALLRLQLERSQGFGS